MNTKKLSLINSILSLILTLGAVFLVAFLASSEGGSIPKFIAAFIGGLIVWGIISIIMHELGHVIAGKKNGMELISVRFLFVEFYKLNGKLKVKLSGLSDAAGETTLIPKNIDNAERGYKKETLGGLIGSGILLIISIVLVALRALLLVKLPYLYAFLSVSFAVGVYSFFNNALPVTEDGVMNDGAVFRSLKKQDDDSKVLINVLKITAELYSGKSPAEIDKALYFDLPQLPEDDVNFATILTHRYAYYLDIGDRVNAIKTAKRIESILDVVPKAVRKQLVVELVYVYSYLSKSEYDADDYMDEAGRILNSTNSLTNLRIKSAYLAFILNEVERAEEFIDKGINDAKDGQIKGLSKYEEKLLKDLKANLPQIEVKPEETKSEE